MSTRRRQGTVARTACVLLVLVGGAVAWGKSRIVTTKQGKTFEGEVTEKGEAVIIIAKGGTKITLQRANVESIKDAVSVEDQFRERLADLPKNDSPARVELARWALDRKEYDLALDALDDAIAIDPNNEDARQMQRSVLKQRRLQKSPAAPQTDEAAPAGEKSAEQTGRAAPTAGQPADAEPDATEAAAKAVPDDSARPRAGEKTGADEKQGADPRKLRLVTPEEVNRIRQLELQKGERVQIRLQNDVKRRYLSSSEFTPQQFNAMTPQEQGSEILGNGSSRLHADVIVASDPASLAQFKRAVQRHVLPGCASSSCHGGSEGGDFFLHNPANKDEETYTNFLLMQGYKTTLDGKDYAMIDRPRPETSLVLLYGLPQSDSPLPHPKAQNFRPVFKGTNDPKYKAINDWLGSTLAPLPPEYGIDLSEGAAGAATRPSRPAREPADNRP